MRGAISIEKDESEFIDEMVKELFGSFLSQSGDFFEKTHAIIFSVTEDIRSKNPAKSLREIFSKANGISLMVVKEADFDGSACRILRALVFYEGPDLKPVYLRKAVSLRPDIAGN